MKLRWFVVATVAVAVSVSSAFAGGNAYVGADGCKMCHKSKIKGDQYGQWMESKHAQAFKTLGTEEAKKAGKAKGVTDPQKDPKCLKCHVTGYAADAALHTKKWNQEEGISCEGCHGAGAAYAKKEIMKDEAKAKEAGLIVPDEKSCKTCHNEESPTYKSFKFEEMKKKIAHPNPNKGKDVPDEK